MMEKSSIAAGVMKTSRSRACEERVRVRVRGYAATARACLTVQILIPNHMYLDVGAWYMSSIYEWQKSQSC